MQNSTCEFLCRITHAPFDGVRLTAATAHDGLGGAFNAAQAGKLRDICGAGFVRGFVGLGLCRREIRHAYVEPLTFLTLRMSAVVFLLAILAFLTRPTWPDLTGVRHSIIAGLLMHGVYLGGVFISIDRRLPAGPSALVVSLQPVLTSTIANRYLGERVVAR